MRIRKDDLTHPEVLSLLAVHLGSALENNPEGLSHALPVDALRRQDVTFWTVWSETGAMGFAALKELSCDHGEIKSVHTAKAHRRKGVSSALMKHLISEARSRNYKRLSLETHPTEGYAAARALYERLGFEYCGPFGDYEHHPNSVFMTLNL